MKKYFLLKNKTYSEEFSLQGRFYLNEKRVFTTELFPLQK